MTEKSSDQPPTSPTADVLADLRATSRWQERVYKQLHAHPELSFQETETAALAASKLREFGYEVLEGIGRTGVVGVLRNGAGPIVLARADMDALPVKENTLFTALGELDTTFAAMSDLFLGRTDNVAIRFAAGVALLFNVLMVVIAIVAIIMTVPKDDRRESVNV